MEAKVEHGLAIRYASLPRSHEPWKTVAVMDVKANKVAWLLRDVGCLQTYEKPNCVLHQEESPGSSEVILSGHFHNTTLSPDLHVCRSRQLHA